MGRGIAGCGAATFTGAKQGNRGKWSPERTIGRGRCGEQGAPPHRSSYWWSPAVAIGPVDLVAGRQIHRARSTHGCCCCRWPLALQRPDRFLEFGDAVLQIGLPGGEHVDLCSLGVDAARELLDVGVGVVVSLGQILHHLVKVGLERRIHGGEESLTIGRLLARLQRGEEGWAGD